MVKYCTPAGSATTRNYIGKLFKFLPVVAAILFISCSNDGDKSKNSTSVESTKDSSSADKNQLVATGPIRFPIFKVRLSDLKDQQHNQKLKIILKLYFEDFPNTPGMKLKLYPGKKKDHDGTAEKLIPVTMDTGSAPISSRNFTFGTTHADLKSLITNIGTDIVDSLLLIPGINVYEGENYLGFRIAYYKKGGIAEELIDVGISNPSPPAPPGFIIPFKPGNKQ